MSKTKNQAPRSDIFSDVREAIPRDPFRWHQSVGIDTETLSKGQGTPCPLGCGGEGNDRLHGTPSFKSDGSVRCRQEDKVFDAFNAYIAAGKAATLLEAAKQLADLYGVALPPPKKEKPADYYVVEPQLYNFALASPWFTAKRITEKAFFAAGGSLVKYMEDTFIGIPAYAADSDFTQPVRWILYDCLGQQVKVPGGTAPNKCIKVAENSPKGLIGLSGLRNLSDAEIVVKVEGSTDLLRTWDAIPPTERNRYSVITNANGCNENPSPEAVELVREKTVYVVGDADTPGQAGALKWATAFATTAKEVFSVKLPYPVEESHGKDIRDYFNEEKTFDDFLKLEKKIVTRQSQGSVGSEKADTSPTFVSGRDLFPAFCDDVLHGDPPPVWLATADPQDPINRFSLCPGKIIVLGGAPGAGKTAFIMQTAFDILIHNPEIKTLFCNVEMEPQDLLERLLSRYSGVPLRDIIERKRYESTPRKLQEGLDEIAKVIDRTAFVTSAYTIERIKKAATQFESEIVVIDYCQRIRLATERPGAQPRERTNDIMDASRRIAKSGKCVVVVSALSRQSGKGKSYNDAGLDSFRESSELEYGADAAYILTHVSQDVPDHEKKRLLRCVKKRNGAKEDTLLWFDGQYQHFGPYQEMPDSAFVMTPPDDQATETTKSNGEEVTSDEF